MRELKANLEESQSKLKELEKSKKKMPEDHVREMEEMKKKNPTNGAITQRRAIVVLN